MLLLRRLRTSSDPVVEGCRSTDDAAVERGAAEAAAGAAADRDPAIDMDDTFDRDRLSVSVSLSVVSIAPGGFVDSGERVLVSDLFCSLAACAA